MSYRNIAIIGAGPAGLTAAYFLLEKGMTVNVYEAGKEIGGLSGSVSCFGKSFDTGPHIFLESSQPEAVEFWKKIGGEDLVTTQLNRGMILRKNIIGFPPTPVTLLKALGIFRFGRAALSTVMAKLRRKKSFTSSGEFFRNQYGNYFRKNIFNPFCEKYMGLPDLRVDSNFATGLTSFVKESGKTDVVTDENKLKNLMYPKQGTKMMWSRIAEKVMSKGEINFEKKLIRVSTQGDEVKTLYFSDGTEVCPEMVVTSLPVVLLLRLMDSTPPSILEVCQTLHYRNTVLVYIELSGEARNFHYVTVFDHSIEAGRITNFNAWPLESLTNSAETILCVEYWCQSHDPNWTCSQEDISAKAVSELREAGIIRKGNIKNTHVVRIEKSHPVLSIEHGPALAEINAYLGKFKNLVLAGRHATFKWDGQADNISAGIKLADRISAMAS